MDKHGIETAAELPAGDETPPPPAPLAWREHAHRANLARRAAFWARVPRAFRELEPILSQRKWFDYRYTCVIESSEHFLKSYQRLSGLVNRDYHLGRSKKNGVGARGVNMGCTDDRTFTSIYRARAEADCQGLPYEFFLKHSLRHLVEKAKYDGIPRPNQVYSQTALKQTLPVLQRLWREMNGPGGRAQYSTLPQYAAACYRDDPHQKDHLHWLIKLIRMRPAQEFMLRSVWLDQGLMPSEWVQLIFPAEVIDSATAHGPCCFELPLWVTDGSLSEGLADSHFRPSCFGVPDAPAANPDICGKCRFRSSCEALGSSITAEMTSRYGSSDPVLAKKRRNAVERQRKSRAKKRAWKEARRPGCIDPDDPEQIILVPR